jgi:glycosyltransferase involved in cell wall biosynthesis
MHILTALTYYRPHYSGLTIYAEREAVALGKRGHQVTILTSRFDNQLPANERRDGIEIVRPRVLFHISKGVIMPSMPYWAWKLARKADVIQLHVPQLDAALIAILCKLMGKPIVLTYHCDLRLPSGAIHAAANLASNLANRITASLADVVVTNTQDYAQNSIFLKPYLNKLQTVYPPVEIQPFSQLEVDAFREKFRIIPGQRLIGMAARLAAEKGVEYLAKAIPKVLERHPTARVLFVGPYQQVLGEDAYARRVIPQIKNLGEHWTFLGVLPPEEMAVFFHLCEVTVLPSLNSTESFGLVQVESMACNTPVIAANLPGVRVPVQVTNAGLLVPPEDAEALARALISILDEPEAFRGQTETLTGPSAPEAVAKTYEEIFKELVQRKRSK